MSDRPAVEEKTFRLDLAYEGTDFIGWQRQAEGRSVQSCLEEAVRRVTRNEPAIHAAGRTDSGVHAEQLVVRLRVRTYFDDRVFLRALNSVLPHDISITRVEEVAPDWDPRRLAIQRTYYYAILNRPARSCLLWRRVFHCYSPLDARAMHHAAQHLVGEHDFTSFRSLRCGAVHPVRTMTNAEVIRRGELIYLLVQGQAFLRNMIRIIAGTLVEVGRGMRSADDIPDILQAKERDSAGVTLTASGLTLAHIQYEGDSGYTRDDLPVWRP